MICFSKSHSFTVSCSRWLHQVKQNEWKYVLQFRVLLFHIVFFVILHMSLALMFSCSRTIKVISSSYHYTRNLADVYLMHNIRRRHA
jgi:hypothetical protein